MTTTEQLISRYKRLKSYEKLYMKRRFKAGYEADWIEITNFMIDSSTSIEQKLDWESYGYGEVRSGSAQFELNNLNGDFNAQGELYSFFQDTISRQYTKILYKAGYYDETGQIIDESIFEGFLNEKNVRENFEKGTVNITAMSYSQIFTEQSTISGSLIASMTAFQVVELLMQNSEISNVIGYDSSKISFGQNITFDDARKFENTEMREVLTQICQKTNSIWYVDSENDLVVKPRTANANTPHQFTGGALQRFSANIISIESYDSGFTKIINEVIYDTGDQKIQIRPDIDNTILNGVQTLNIGGEDLTDETKITQISESIIEEWKRPRKRVVLSTVYTPNVYEFFDRCIIDYRPEVRQFPDKEILVFNQNDNFNGGLYISRYKNRIIFNSTETYLYFGYSHNVRSGTTKHYLIQQ